MNKNRFIEWIRNTKILHYKYLLTILAFSVLISGSFYLTKTMFSNYQKNEVSESNVFSPQTTTFIDEVETNKQKELLISQVQEVYELDPTIQQEQIDKLKKFFASVIEQKRRKEDENLLKSSVSTFGINVKTNDKLTSEQYTSSIENPYQFKKEELEVFFNASVADLNTMKEVFAKEIEKFYSTGITEEKINEVRKTFGNNTNFYFFDEKMRNLLLGKITPQLKANFKLDEEQTKQRKEEAEKSVKPVMKSVQKGEMIIRRGEVITENHIATLKALGLMSEKFEIKEGIKRFPLTFALLFCLHLFLYQFSNREIQNKKLYLFVFIVTAISTFSSNFLQDDYFTYGLLVMSLVAITTFLSSSFSILYAVVLSALLGQGNYTLLIIGVVLGVVQAIGHNPTGNRIAFLRLGAIMSIVASITYFAVNYLNGTPFITSDYYPLLVSPIIASALVLGLFPILEGVLGVITSVRLHELTSTSQPLIKRLINEAPGTFHHSLKVGNLAEAAAEEIGANALLLKVGAYFHDVGKLEHPMYFIENTTPETNPHNFLTPKESAAYILQHPIDSVKLCRKHNIPEQIIELIEKHHGDSILHHYIREKENNPDCNIEDFRYKTPTPKTKEEGILMLADATEAYSRVIAHETPEVFREKLRDMLYHKIEDGQLRDCELTMKEIGIIIETFVAYLLRSNHQRVPYPDKK